MAGKGKLFQIAFEIGGKLAPGFGKSILSASSNLDKLNEKVSGLGKVRGDMSTFEKLKGGIGDTKTSLVKAREEVRRLAAQMKATDKPTAAMSRKFGAAKKSVNLLQDKLRSQRSELKNLSSELRKAGISTRNFAKAQADLDAKIAKASSLRNKIQANQSAQGANRTRREQYKSRMVGAAVTVGAIAAPLMVAANFEKSMNKVEAVSGATGESLDALRASARKMGAETQFSATQAAEAQNYLAMAGFDAEKIVSTLPDVLNLAAAGDLDLGRAADISSDVLSAFGLGSEDMGHLVDVFASAANSANTDVEMLGDSMTYAAKSAKDAGISIEEATAMLGLMANEGIKGSRAGTALRGALVRLAKQPKEAKEALKDLKVEIDDGEGNMRSMEAILKDLAEATSDMGTADRSAALAKIFGTEALSGMLTVMEKAASGELADFTDSLKKSDGAAAKMAETMNKGAVGAMSRLKSAMESVAIDAGNVLLPSFASAVEGLASFVGGISLVAQKHPAFTKAIVVVTTSLALLKVATLGVGYSWTFVKGGFLAAAGVFHNVRAAALLATGGHKALIAAQLEGTTVSKMATKAQFLWGKAVGVFNAGKQIVAMGLLKTKTLAYAVAQNVAIKTQLLWNKTANVFNAGKHALAMGVLKAKTLALSAAQKVATGAQWAFNAAMNANPIGLVIAGITALVTAGVMLYKNWDVVSEKFVTAWGWIHNKVSGVVDWFSGIPGRIAGWFDGVGDKISAPFGAVPELVRTKVSGVVDWFSGIPGRIADALAGVGDVILKPFGVAFQKISEFLGKIGELWGKLKKAIAGDPEVQKINAQAHLDTSSWVSTVSNSDVGLDKRAEGGVATSPTLSIWGEAGREYMIPVTSPNDDRGRALWYAAGRDLGLIEEGNSDKKKKSPFVGAYGFLADAVDAWDVAMLGKKGLQFAGRQLGGMATGIAAASSGVGRPGVGLGTMAALGAAGTLAFMGLSGFVGGENGVTSAGASPVSPPESSLEIQSPASNIHINYSPTFHITTVGDGRSVAGDIDKVLRGDINELIERIREAEEQERRVALE